jgi:hypothetical protein
MKENVMKISLVFGCAMLTTACLAGAQNAPAPEERHKIEMFEVAPGPGSDAMFVSIEPMGMGKIMKGAPFSATAVTESTQTLADGNRIVKKQSTQFARDGEGRIRRELGEMAGPVQLDGPKMVMIHDPVANTAVVLNPAAQTARVMKHENGPGIHSTERMRVQHEKAMANGPKRMFADGSNVTVESLGTQTIEGVAAEGHRETRTIPAGAIGNEQPINITTETWQSKDLGVVIMRKRSDPRFGETVYKLTNIKTGEPDPSLFQIPAGFKTETGPMRRVPLPPPPPSE